MNDQMLIETLIIMSSFFAVTAVLVLSVLLIERTGQLHNAAEIDRLWLRSTQITRGLQSNGFTQHAYIEDDFIKSLGEQEVSDQFESWMEAEGGDRTEGIAYEFTDFHRVGQRSAQSAYMAGELAQIGLLIGSEDRQNVLIYAIASDFAYQRLSPLA